MSVQVLGWMRELATAADYYSGPTALEEEVEAIRHTGKSFLSSLPVELVIMPGLSIIIGFE